MNGFTKSPWMLIYKGKCPEPTLTFQLKPLKGEVRHRQLPIKRYRLEKKRLLHSLFLLTLSFYSFHFQPKWAKERQNAAKAPLLCGVHRQQSCPRYSEKGQEWILTRAMQRYAMHAEQPDSYSCNSPAQECLQKRLENHGHAQFG